MILMVPGVSQESANEKLLLAAWRTGLYGLRWLDELVQEGKAKDLGGSGYPCRYTAAAGHIIRKISPGPPPDDSPQVIGDDYYLPSGWTGEIQIDHAKIARCAPDEQLLIEAWDQS